MKTRLVGSLCLLMLMSVTHNANSAQPLGLEDVDTPDMLEAKADARLDWSHFAKHDPAGAVEVDASAYKRIFEEYGDHGPSAALDFLYLSRRGIGSLSAFVRALQEVPVSSLNRNEQLAFWLNLHNAQGILQTVYQYPVRDDNSKIVIFGPAWNEPSLMVEGYRLSLRDIELRILFRQWPDPRVLYGLYLPAAGAPAGPIEPFRGKDVWRQLEHRGHHFVNHGPSHQIVRDQLHVSAFYYLVDTLWTDDKQLLAHLQQYASPKLARTLSRYGSIEATWLNWRLNGFSSGYDVNQDRAGGGS